MDTRYLLKVLALGAGLVLAGCVSTLPDENPPRDPVVYEQKNLKIAFGFLQQGYPARAIGRLEEILKVNGRSARAYGMLGVVYQAQGEYDLAVKHFVHSLDLDASASDVRNNYGVLLYETGKFTQARVQFERVTEDVYYQQRSRAFENLGFVALKMNDPVQAKKQFERALRLDRNLPKASLEMTELLVENGNYVEAERFYENYQRLSSGRPEARSLWLGIKLARVFKNQEQLDDFADQLIRYYPGSQEYRNYQASLRND